MRVAVVGCGAVGSLFAANLARLDDVEVWAYDLDRAHVDAINATVNGVAALTGLPHDHHFAEEEQPGDLGHLVHALVDEGKAVAAAAGVELREDPWEMNVLATRRGSRHYPSMLEDVEARRPTEIDHITGALVREAERLGVPVPLHTALYRLVRAREASWEPE